MKDIKLSDFGQKITSDAGILELMDDLGQAMSGNSKPLAMFGGGNPALIPEVSQMFEDALNDLTKDKTRLHQMFGVYDTPQGNDKFISVIKDYVNHNFGVDISEENIAITPGSQAGFFMLFNILAGTDTSECKKTGDGHTSSLCELSLRETEENLQEVHSPSIAEEKFTEAEEVSRVVGSAEKQACRCVRRHILFPISPDYIGYADQLIESGSIKSYQPIIEKISDHEFKYHVDFQALEIDKNSAGICVSRPTNPSGNVVSAEEIDRLQQLAEMHDIPLIIDNAYGDPFPGVVEGERLKMGPNTIFSFSLSKVGLPGSRTGIFIGPAEIMRKLSSANAVLNLASPNFGQYLTTDLFTSGKIDEISESHIKPYYAGRYAKAYELIEKHFDKSLPWRFHTYEGSYFLWLWLDGANKTSKEIYASLKQKGVLVVPGEYFFYGVDTENWPHAKQCIRINFARPDAELEAGIPILAQEIAELYS